MSGDDFLQELKTDFLNEALFMMEQYEESMLALESAEDPQEHIGRIFRVAHSIKGGAAAVGFEDLSKFAHTAEDLLSILRVYPDRINTEIITLFLAVGDQFKSRLSQLKSGELLDWDVSALKQDLQKWIEHFQPEKKAPESVPVAVVQPAETTTDDVTNYELLAELEAQMGIAPSTPPKLAEAPKTAPSQPGAVATKKQQQENAILKVDSLRVDAVLDVVGEIVVLKNQLIHSDAVRAGTDQRLNFIVDQIDKSIRDLYDKTLGIRMTPLKSLFMKLQRTVRDVSVRLQKPVDLQLIGEETEVDRSVFELLGDPLMHMSRNAMDHGIESAEERHQLGKPATAQLMISAKQVGGSVQIEIQEDGRGIDRDKVLKKALEKGLVADPSKASEMSDNDVYMLLFAPGFSTAEVVTDLSGRGVGLDVVKSNIERVKGSISVKSSLGQGTTFKISIPLTTSITDGIVVSILGHNYMVPIHSIREIVQFKDEEVTNVANVGQVLKIRDQLTPVLDLEKALMRVQDLNQKKSQSMGESSARLQKTFVVVESSQGLAALKVDDVIGQSQVVAKPLQVGHSVPEFSGAATLGDGRTILILEPGALVQSQTKSQTEAA